MTRIAALMIALTTLAACETAEGFGRDVEDLGENIQDEAD
ncbi:entericidin A/B family lipoprotein [Thalassococcus sp. S3]|nr:entericidin A/B family lipoprotein [Thalassococcus sp. S3]QBF31029.1 entericidin [Thalassococcus sp. S3]